MRREVIYFWWVQCVSIWKKRKGPVCVLGVTSISRHDSQSFITLYWFAASTLLRLFMNRLNKRKLFNSAICMFRWHFSNRLDIHKSIDAHTWIEICPIPAEHVYEGVTIQCIYFCMTGIGFSKLNSHIYSVFKNLNLLYLQAVLEVQVSLVDLHCPRKKKNAQICFMSLFYLLLYIVTM